MALLNPDFTADDEPQKLSDGAWKGWTSEYPEQGAAEQLAIPSTTASSNTYTTLQELDIQLTTLNDQATMPMSSARSSPAPETQSTINDETVYIGESNLLTLVATGDSHESSSIDASRLDISNLAYQLPNSANETAASKGYTSTCTSSTVEYLNREGAFVFPDDHATSALLHAYFQWFHPCFPIVDASKISREYNTKTSPMLLQAMLFIGTSYLADDFFVSSNLISRQDAKFRFYHRAKILYDAGWEANTTAILQTLFLISFWRSNANNDKDTRHWLASAVSLAQTRGYHRSLCRRSSLDTQGRYFLSLRKRIWWSLYVSCDRLDCSSSLTPADPRSSMRSIPGTSKSNTRRGL